jgi:tungstate transport system permease protein
MSSLDPAARETALALGASRKRILLTIAWEARYGLLAAIAAAGGRLIGEVGVSMMLGGNLEHHTRNLTTAIALETSKGEFAVAMALGIILLVLALALNFLLRWLRGRREASS